MIKNAPLAIARRFWTYLLDKFQAFSLYSLCLKAFNTKEIGIFLLIFLGFSTLFTSCVTKKAFLEQTIQHKNSQDSLLNIVQAFDYVNDTLRLALSYERGSNTALVSTQDRLQDRLDILQREIDRRGENATTREQMLLREIGDEKTEVQFLNTHLLAIQAIMNENSQRLSLLKTTIEPLFEDIDEELFLIRKRTGHLIITLNENVLFRPSSTSKLLDKGKTLLENIGEILLQYPAFKIQVLGHTDNKDNGRQSLDNWQYSALRAVSVVKHLTAFTDLGANRVIAASKSEFAPLQSNESKEGRASNRRIELIIAPPLGFLEQKAIGIIDEALIGGK